MAKKKNPVLQKKYDEGYVDGFNAGAEFGRKTAIQFFAKRFKQLEQTKGIGQATLDKIKQALGRQYFK